MNYMASRFRCNILTSIFLLYTEWHFFSLCIFLFIITYILILYRHIIYVFMESKNTYFLYYGPIIKALYACMFCIINLLPCWKQHQQYCWAMINHIHIEFPQIRGISNGRIICACYPHLSACKSAHFPHIQKVRGNFNSHKGKT